MTVQRDRVILSHSYSDSIHICTAGTDRSRERERPEEMKIRHLLFVYSVSARNRERAGAEREMT